MAWNKNKKSSDTDNKLAEIKPESRQIQEYDICDLFPVVQVPESSLAQYKKVPLTGLGALGAAFSQLPKTARTIVQSTTTNVGLKETLFVGINPKGVPGYLMANNYGTVGNIMQINEQGKQVIAGRLRFKAIDSLPITETSSVAMPFDPTLMVIAVAVMAVEQKLDKIQASVEEVLQFLELDKQAKQRGNLRMLAEIADDYKEKCLDKEFCANRAVAIQTIQKESFQDIEFYEGQINLKLQKQKAIHVGKDASTLVNSVAHEFAEYQLACYLYAYSSFLDVMLRRDFASGVLEKTATRLNALAEKYNALYSNCRSQVADYQRGALDAKVVGGLGIAAKNIGKAIGSIPVIREGPVDEALISAGDSLGKLNRNAVQNQVESIAYFEDCRMDSFIDSLTSINLIYNKKDSLLTDGEHLYVLSAASA